MRKRRDNARVGEKAGQKKSETWRGGRFCSPEIDHEGMLEKNASVGVGQHPKEWGNKE